MYFTIAWMINFVIAFVFSFCTASEIYRTFCLENLCLLGGGILVLTIIIIIAVVIRMVRNFSPVRSDNSDNEFEQDLEYQQYFDDGADFGFALVPVIFLLLIFGLFIICLIVNKLTGISEYSLYTWVTLIASVYIDISMKQ